MYNPRATNCSNVTQVYFPCSLKVATGKSRLHPGVFSSAAMQTVSEVLNKLLVVGITDLDADVRYAVLDSFDDQFDPHLAQAENLSALFVSLQVRDNRECLGD